MRKAVICLLLILFLTGCGAKETENKLVASSEMLSPYAGIVLQTLPGYGLKTQAESIYAELPGAMRQPALTSRRSPPWSKGWAGTGIPTVWPPW